MDSNRTHYWGELTIENVERVAERLTNLLAGKLYTFVSSHEIRQFQPEIRINQRLEGGRDNIHIRWSSQNSRLRITIGDTYGLWWIENNFKPATFEFKNDYEGDQVWFTWYTEAGLRSHYNIMVEGPDESAKYPQAITALRHISRVAGNLPDSRHTTATGPGDAVHRGLLVTQSRAIAIRTLIGLGEWTEDDADLLEPVISGWEQSNNNNS